MSECVSGLGIGLGHVVDAGQEREHFLSPHAQVGRGRAIQYRQIRLIRIVGSKSIQYLRELKIIVNFEIISHYWFKQQGARNLITWSKLGVGGLGW